MTPEDIHVVPLNDLHEHIERRDCWCAPRLEEVEDGVMVVHAALDGRELIERHGLQ